MRNLLLHLCFDGRHYHGWQVQQNALAIQTVVQNAIEKVFGSRLDVVGCSRTDTGVHANMFCLNFHTDSSIAVERVPAALNVNLPYDIAVLRAAEVDEGFHARYDTISKQYQYKIYNARIRNPFIHGLALHYHTRLDEGTLDEACRSFLGRHDFRTFCSAGTDVEDTFRTVSSARVFREGDLVIFEVEADGFLYHMVRIMVGTLLEVASGRIDPASLEERVAARDRGQAGFTAPACGLYLNNVEYGRKVW